MLAIKSGYLQAKTITNFN